MTKTRHDTAKNRQPPNESTDNPYAVLTTPSDDSTIVPDTMKTDHDATRRSKQNFVMFKGSIKSEKHMILQGIKGIGKTLEFRGRAYNKHDEQLATLNMATPIVTLCKYLLKITKEGYIMPHNTDQTKIRYHTRFIKKFGARQQTDSDTDSSLSTSACSSLMSSRLGKASSMVADAQHDIGWRSRRQIYLKLWINALPLYARLKFIQCL